MDHELLIFIPALQNMLITDSSPVRENFDSDVKKNKNARTLQGFQMDSFEAE